MFSTLSLDKQFHIDTFVSHFSSFGSLKMSLPCLLVFVSHLVSLIDAPLEAGVSIFSRCF